MARDEKDTAIYVAYEDWDLIDTAAAEKDLLRAVLLGAMQDLRKNGDFAKKAREYFLSPENDYIFSFRSICHLLDIDRSKVLRVVGLLNSASESCKFSNQNPKEIKADR